MATKIKTQVPQTLAELEANRKFVEETFKIMGEYLSEFLYTDQMKKEFEDFQWNTLGNYDCDISHEKNMRKIERWESLTRHHRTN